MSTIKTSVYKNSAYAACYSIICLGNLTNEEAPMIRQTLMNAVAIGYPTIYLDAKQVVNIDLSGINEVINAAYTLDGTPSQLVFIYKKGTAVEKWVATTALDHYVQTAVLPAA